MLRKDIIDLMEEYAKASGDKLDHFSLQDNKLKFNDIVSDNFDSFSNQLNDVAEFCRYNFDTLTATPADFKELLGNLTFPLIIFLKGNKEITPAIIKHREGKTINLVVKKNGEWISELYQSEDEVITKVKKAAELNSDNQLLLSTLNEEEHIEPNTIIYLAGYKFNFGAAGHENMSPLKRFFSLLRSEKRDVGYIYFFAIMVAMVSLTLPLGIQAIIGLISGGLLIESVIVLMFLVVVATFASGWLQVQQLSIVEILQQRVFAKTALEFSFRIPRIKAEAINKHYAPELINRFFDIVNVQKSLPKILIDFTSAIVQILFGLVLLSFYHPLFILFALFILAILAVIFYSTGKKGLETSINESKYKYKVAFWLEELGRSMNSFKLAGYANLPVSKTDKLLDGYLQYRKKHFNILVKQYISIIGFKTIVTAGLLIMGGLLVVNRQINLGQFVAAEIIILLVITSVEKLISTISVIYDMLTAVDKLGHVLDLPLENNEGREVQDLNIDNEFNLELKSVSYTYPESKSASLKNISLKINGNKKICIAGFNDAGKTTLLKVISGLYNNYSGVITLNNLSIKELNLNSFRAIIGDNLSVDDVFEGSIFENITLGRGGILLQDVLDACNKACLLDFVNQLSDGLKTKVHPNGSNLPSNVVKKILLARSFIQKPKLLVIDEFFNNVQKLDKINLINNIFQSNDWAVLIVSSQEAIMQMCDEVHIMRNGEITASGSYQELVQTNKIKDLLN